MFISSSFFRKHQSHTEFKTVRIMSVCSDVTVILTVRLLVQEVQQKVFIEINFNLVQIKKENKEDRC